MKKSILALVTMAVLGSGSVLAVDGSETATGNFQWTGKVLPANTSDGLIIQKAPGSIDHAAGALIFDNDGTKITLRSSDILSFQVFEQVDGSDPATATGDPLTQYTYELQTLAITAGGVTLSNTTPAFKITGNGVDVPALGTQVTNNSDGAETIDLQVVQQTADEDLETHGIVENTTVNVIATILITDPVNPV